MEQTVIVINDSDNVAIALKDLSAGTVIGLPAGGEIEARGDIPYSHKVAMADLSEGDPIIKYGEVIGRAAEDISRGEWIHTHNMRSAEEEQ